MKSLLLLLFVTIGLHHVNAQSPGGTSQGSLVWIKGNTGTTPAVGTGTLTAWANSGTAGAITVNGTPVFEELGYNYNPKVHFNGNGNFLGHPGVIFGSIYAIVELEDLTRVYTHLSTWTNMCGGPNADGTLHGGINTGDGAYELTGYSPEFDGAGVWRSDGLPTGHTSPYSGANDLVSAVANSGDMDTYGDRLLGGQPCLPSRDWLGDASEVIVLTGTSTPAERNQIESYLAIKYGITLDNSGGGTQGDYFATTGATIWDASVAASYHNNVIGIGRENSEALYQKQSHTLTDTSRIYLSTLTTTNAANAGTFNDFSYILIGDNQDMMCATTASNLETPLGCGLYSRLEREWKVTKTSTGVDFNFDATLNPCSSVGSVTVSNLRLLVDDDGDFSNGGTTCYFNGDGSGIVISYTSPVVTVSNISNAMIPNNTTRFMTIASSNPVTPLPVEITGFDVECLKDKVALNWSTNSELNNAYFTLERSRDAINFETITIIDGNGTSLSPKYYEWTDDNSFPNTSYYRLSQTDLNGVTERYSLRSVNCGTNADITIYPNPVEQEFILNSNYGGTLKLIDNAGKTILNQVFFAGENSISVDHIASGSYIVYISLNNGKQNFQKLIKL
ncbi:MAG: hypothetical protein COA38_00755 [Fluviicola sp.]|nr:MAG: hypothetical protein COA38_00755 [Fluviicola sp.]